MDGTPGPVVAQDVNRDQHVDLVVGDLERRAVVVLLGDGHGRFREVGGSPFPAGGVPEDLAFADFNGDRHVDLAVANHESPTITILLNDQTGRFPSRSTIVVRSNPHPHGIVAADFNGDGRTDLATESWEDDEVVAIFAGVGKSFVEPHSRLGVGHVPYYKLRSKDLNHDRLADLVTTNWGGASVSVLLADSTGGFHPSRMISTRPSPFAVAIGDLNVDGHQDIATVHRLGDASRNEADAFSILLGNGSGEFLPVDGSLPSSGLSPTSLAVGDFDGDKASDVAIANFGSSDVTVVLGGDVGFRLSKGSPYSVDEGPSAVLLEDLNHDGRADIVTSSSESRSLSIVLSVPVSEILR